MAVPIELQTKALLARLELITLEVRQGKLAAAQVHLETCQMELLKLRADLLNRATRVKIRSRTPENRPAIKLRAI